MFIESIQCIIITTLYTFIIFNNPLITCYVTYAGIEFKDFILGFRQSTFLCTTLKCIEKFRIPFIKSGIPASNLGFTEARNPLKFAACLCVSHTHQLGCQVRSDFRFLESSCAVQTSMKSLWLLETLTCSRSEDMASVADTALNHHSLTWGSLEHFLCIGLSDPLPYTRQMMMVTLVLLVGTLGDRYQSHPAIDPVTRPSCLKPGGKHALTWVNKCYGADCPFWTGRWSEEFWNQFMFVSACHCINNSSHYGYRSLWGKWIVPGVIIMWTTGVQGRPSTNPAPPELQGLHFGKAIKKIII